MNGQREHERTPRDVFPAEDIVATAWGILRRRGREPARWLLVDVANQRLILIQQGHAAREYPVSTAAAGIDGHKDSGGTPPGMHTIALKIGADAPVGTIFRDRLDTGERWQPSDPPLSEDLILTRILALAGEEEGLNSGPGCDSFSRHIYIHGTNQEDKIGQPVSHGCIRMTNRDVLDVFTRVEEGDPLVVI
jgi:UDP-N-acetylmuramate--alanine ligase